MSNIVDIQAREVLDSRGNPVVVFSTQKDSAGLPPKQGGHDFRFHRAAWNGKQWAAEEIAFGGSRLYAGEDDYTGLMALDPFDPQTVFISTNADPSTGHPLKSAADGQRHWEIYRALKPASGKWSWTALTQDSTRDNLRPVVDQGEGEWVVPAGRYLVIGDNRDRSEDGRFWGMLPEDRLRGKAFLVWLNCSNWFCSDSFDTSRIGNDIP